MTTTTMNDLLLQRIMEEEEDEADDVFTGVPSSYEDLYMTMVFLAALFLVGDVICRRCLVIVPPLVGHIVVGILFGPQGLDLIQPSPEQWVLLGNLGLLLLMVQAGLEMDIHILKVVGPRGIVIAVIGSILPISIGTGLASVFLSNSYPELSWKSALAAGCSFGPTSAGIAMNVLGQCEVLQTPVGQLIVAAAIVDDILALVVLSQLRALTTEDTPQVSDILIPIVSAFLWLLIGGATALFVFPRLFDSFIVKRFGGAPNIEIGKQAASKKASILFLIGLFVLLFGMLPATFYSQSSYLMGAFLSGLAFCQNHTELEVLFSRQFKRVMSWMMKVFFAATIGFQVPVRSFSDGTIIGRGLLFLLALTGKLAVGFLAPNFYSHEVSESSPTENLTESSSSTTTTTTPSKHFRGKHLRDCFVVGLSMMGEAEFAFVVAVFGVTEGLVPPDIYASIVLAILLSTILSPLLLRTTLAFFPYGDTDDNEKEEEEEEKEDADRIKSKKSSIGELDSAGCACMENDGSTVSNGDTTGDLPHLQETTTSWFIQMECVTHSSELPGMVTKVLLSNNVLKNLSWMDYRSWNSNTTTTTTTSTTTTIDTGTPTPRRTWIGLYVKDNMLQHMAMQNSWQEGQEQTVMSTRQAEIGSALRVLLDDDSLFQETTMSVTCDIVLTNTDWDLLSYTSDRLEIREQEVRERYNAALLSNSFRQWAGS